MILQTQNTLRGIMFSLLCLLPVFAAASPVDISPYAFVPQVGHSFEVRSLVFSHDGKRLVSESGDGSIKVWDVKTQREVRSLRFEYSFMDALAVTPDDRFIVCADRVGADIYFIDMLTGLIGRTFHSPAGMFTDFFLSKDGLFLAAACNDNTVRVWDVPSGKIVGVLTGCSAPIISVRIDNDDSCLYAISKDQSLTKWSLKEGRLNWSVEWPLAVARLTSIAISPDGMKIVTGTSEKSIVVWNAETGKNMQTLYGPSDTVDRVCFGNDGQYIFSSSEDGTVRRWDINTGAMAPVAVFSSSVLWGLCASPSGDFLAVSSDKEINVFAIPDGRSVARFSGTTDRFMGMAITPDGKFICAGSRSGRVYEWDILHARFVHSFDTQRGSFALRALAPDGKEMVGQWPGLGAGFISLADEKISAVGDENMLTLPAAAYSPDGRYYAFAYYEKNICVYDRANGAEISRYEGFPSRAVSLSFSGDGEFLAAGYADGTIRVFDRLSGAMKELLSLVQGSCSRVGFSPDGRYLIFRSASSRGTDLCIDWRTEEIIRTNDPAYENICAYAFSPDSQKILYTDGDAICVWDIAARLTVQRFTEKCEACSVLEYTPDGKFAVSLGYDNTLRVWDAAVGTLVYSVVCSNSGAWLVYTPDGYWDGSADCLDLVAMVHGLDAFSVDQFAARNNRPDIILQRVGCDDEALIQHYRNQYLSRVKKLGLSENTLSYDPAAIPVAEIKAIGQTDRQLKIAAHFLAVASPLKSWKIWVNGVPVGVDSAKELSGFSADAFETVVLNPGDNTIEVSCITEAGAEAFRDSLSVRYDGSVKGHLYYLGFGVSEYADTNLSLKWAAKDALDLAKLFGSAKYLDVTVKTWTDAEVTPSALCIAKDILSSANSEDTVIAFIAGHGLHDTDAQSTYYYLPYNVDPDRLAETAIPFSAIENLLQGIAPRHKLLLMDTCESGDADPVNDDGSSGVALAPNGVTSRGVTIRRASKIPASVLAALRERERWIYNDIVRRSGSIVFSSCRGNEACYEFDLLENGAFTSALKKTLTDPAADINRDGMISSRELRSSVSTQVSALVSRYCGKDLQHPVVDHDNLLQDTPIRLLTPRN
ncbi:MAG TPA: caspase family protein [Treponemataceae bacterium]|nr:caspase family protein [Treponemataceae bacterium]